MKALRLGVYGVLGAVLLAAVGVGVLGWHQGWRAYAVTTGSMTPTYPTGALVIDRPADDAVPQPGDVITFPTRHGPVTHRVHDVTAAGITTKGDANETPDAWTVPTKNVIGTVAWGASSLGYLVVFLQQPTGVPSLMLLAVSVWLAWSVFFPAQESAVAEHAVERQAGGSTDDRSPGVLPDAGSGSLTPAPLGSVHPAAS